MYGLLPLAFDIQAAYCVRIFDTIQKFKTSPPELTAFFRRVNSEK